MFERLIEYKNKCKVLRQIQSDKALFYKRINDVQNFITVFVSGFITFIGFSGFEDIIKFIHIINSNFDIKIEAVQMCYNLLVFILFIMVIFHMIFRFNDKQVESEKAISLLSGLINEIDDLLENTQSRYTFSSIVDKYLFIIQLIPPNTDKEYLKAKETLEKKYNTVKIIEKHSLYTLTAKEQEKYLINLIQKNTTINNILNIIQTQEEDLYLCGGIIRNIVWDHLHNYHELTPIDDIDIIYFDKQNATKEHDILIENRLTNIMPNFKWSVKNQARMHSINNDIPYTSLADAVSKFPETASAIFLKKNTNGEYVIVAPLGLDDLFRLIVQPTPHFMNKLEKYRHRVLDHNWQEKWKNLKILYMDTTIIK